MTYETFSAAGPINDTGIDPGDIQVIPHNPRHPSRAPVFPTKYPQFVNPTNDQMSRVTVSDEAWTLTDIDQANQNRLYLNHKPQRGSTITVSDGVLNTALTDYENGIVYFSTLPAGDFTVQYLSEPDKYYGEYLEAIQDVLMKVCWMVGAGGDDGLRNAQLFVNELPEALKAKLPNAIQVNALGTDITIASPTDPGAPGGTKHVITLGNGLDTVVVNVKTFDVGESGTTSSPNVTTGEMNAYVDTGDMFVNGTVKQSVWGDMFVAGDIYAMGSFNRVQGTTTIVTQITQGNTNLGENTLDTLYVAGDAHVTGALYVLGVNGPMKVDCDIEFTNGSQRGLSNVVNKVDGMDPSSVEHVRPWMTRNAHDCVLEGRLPVHGAAVQVTSIGALNELISTNVSSALKTTVPNGSHFVGKYDGGEEWMAVCTLGPQALQDIHIPIVAFDTATSKFTLSRNLPTLPTLGTWFYVYRRYFGSGNYLVKTGANQIGIVGNVTFPLVCERNGVIKILDTGNQYLAIPSTDGTYYIFASMTTATGQPESSAPTFFHSTYETPSDQACPLGLAVVSGGVITNVYTYAPQYKHDTGWMRWSATGPFTSYHYQWGTSRSYTGMYLGPTNTAARRRVQILLAPQLGAQVGPDWSQVEVTTPEASGIRVRAPNSGIVIDTSNAGTLPFHGVSDPLWMRVIVGEL